MLALIRVTLILSGIGSSIGAVDDQIVLAADVEPTAVTLVSPLIRRLKYLHYCVRRGQRSQKPADRASAAVEHGVFALRDGHVVRSGIPHLRSRRRQHCNSGQP